ncbi:MAG: SpoIIE family protein phosphatase [Acidobacteriaceae bacterium]
MSHRTLRRCLVLLILLTVSPLFAQTFHLGASPQRILSLNGKWRFHPGDNPQWASPNFNDSAWPLLNSDESWIYQGYPNLSGYAWYRFTIQIPASSPALSINLPPIYTGYQLFENGRLIGSAGNTHPTFAVITPRSQIFPIIGTPAKTPQTILIALRVWHSPLWSSYAGGGPEEAGGLVGPSNILNSIHSLRHDAQLNYYADEYITAFLSGIIGFVILVLFLLRPTEREYLWFAIIQIANCAGYILTLIHGPANLLPIPIFDLFTAILLAVVWVASLYFFSVTLRARRGLWFRLSLVLAVLSPVFIPLYWPGWLSIPVSSLLSVACILPSTLWILALLTRRSLRRDPDALILLAPAALKYGYSILQTVLGSIAQFHPVNFMSWVFGVYIPVYPFHLTLTTIFNILFLVALLIFLIRRFSQARGREEHFNNQLDAARHIQQMLIPESAPAIPGFNINAIYIPADIVGGDFFQQIPDGNGGITLIIGDVSGKGLPAAMMVSLIVGVIHSEAARTTDPAEILTALNERLIAQPHEGFATCLAAHLSPQGLLRLACAGHIPPFRSGNATEMEGSLPIGVVPGAEPSTLTLQLEPNDRLTFISDGVLEAQSLSGELFGFDRTRNCSTMSATEIAEMALRFGQEDDITVLTIDFQPQPQPTPA